MSKTLKNLLVVFICNMVMSSLVYAQVTKNNLDQNADQSQGNYTATNLNYLGSGSLGMIQNA